MNREQLMDLALGMYKTLLSDIAQRYENNTQYIVSDRVGYECTRMEELFRPLWGIAPLLLERNLEISFNGKTVPAEKWITDVIYNGTSPDSPRRFGQNVEGKIQTFRFANQGITEIAGYMLAVYFAREKLWDPLSAEYKEQISSWILKWATIAIKDSIKNNHYWFPIICIEVLKSLGYDCSEADNAVQAGYDFLEKMYLGNGWYCDGVFGRFDYYEVWAHHAYTLLWTIIADKNTDFYKEKADIYKKRTEEFLKFYTHYFDEDGSIPAYGRSISYRFAVVSAFGLAAKCGCDIDYSLARSIVTRNINYFFQKSIPSKDGIFHCGYLYESPAFAESYASDGANCCYTEGFFCLLCDKDNPLWTTPEKPLIIEEKNYLIECPLDGLEIMIQGDNKKNGVTLYNNSIHYFQDDFFDMRFNDMSGYYSKFVYNSRAGFGISTRDTASSDNMISLYTPDGRMTSTRQSIDHYYTKDGMMFSEHTPFSNDPETKIKTCMIPLWNGYHVRVHKVILSQNYIVREGGFSVGYTDDKFVRGENVLTYKNMVSAITVSAPCNVEYKAATEIQPGMHLLKPQAFYPSYTTPVLGKGEYIFATSVYFSTDGTLAESPEIVVDDHNVTVKQDDIVKTVDISKL